MPSSVVRRPHPTDANSQHNDLYNTKAEVTAALALKAEAADLSAKLDSATAALTYAGKTATEAAIAKLTRRVVDVRDYGAVGDDATDDLSALQAAEDAAAALAVTLGTRVGVAFPYSSYAISAPIEKKAGTDWSGPGRLRRIDNASPTGATFSIVTASNVDEWSIDGLGFENVPLSVVESSGITTSTAAGVPNTCIDVRGCENWAIRNCTIEQYTYGIIHQDSRHYVIANNTLRAIYDPAKDRDDYQADMLDATYGADYPNTTTASSGGIVVFYTDGGPSTGNHDYLITGNQIENYGLNTGIDALAQTYDESPGSVTNNVIEGGRCGIQSYRGSFADPGTAPTWDVRALIAVNHISWQWEQGIYLRSAYGHLVSTNILRHTGLLGGGGSGGSVGGIVTRADPADPGLTSPLNNPTPTLITGNILIDTGSPTALTCDGAVQVRVERTIVRGNSITRSTLPTFVTGTADYAVRIDGSESINAFAVESNFISGHHVGVSLAGSFTRNRRNHVWFALWKIDRNEIDTCPDGGIIVDARMVGGSIHRNALTACGTETGKAAIQVKFAPFCDVSGNTIVSGTSGILLSAGNQASSIPRILSESVITDNRRRGGSLTVRNNILSDCTTAHGVNETSGTDVSFFGRCAVWEGDMVNGHPARSTYTATPSTTNNGHTWNPGDIAPKTTPTAATSPAWMCLVGGTAGDTTYSTGDTTLGSPVVTAMSSLDGYGPGIYVTLTGFTGSRKIIDIDVTNSTITLDANAASTNAGATVTVATPTFAAMASLA